DRDLALVLVAVVAGHQQHARPIAVADAGCGDRDPAIGGAVHRMRQAEETYLFAVLVEVDIGGDAAGRFGHMYSGCADQDETVSGTRWQATRWPGPTARNKGSSARQRASA